MKLSVSLPTPFGGTGLTVCIDSGLTLLLDDDRGCAKRAFELIAQGAQSAGFGHCWISELERENNATTGQEWLERRSAHLRTWDSSLATDLIDAFRLGEHFEKPLYMYSLGSARKLCLVAAFASGADITLIAHPFAALDGPSRQVVAEILREASEHAGRAWVVAEFEPPILLDNVSYAAVITL